MEQNLLGAFHKEARTHLSLTVLALHSRLLLLRLRIQPNRSLSRICTETHPCLPQATIWTFLMASLHLHLICIRPDPLGSNHPKNNLVHLFQARPLAELDLSVIDAPLFSLFHLLSPRKPLPLDLKTSMLTPGRHLGGANEPTASRAFPSMVVGLRSTSKTRTFKTKRMTLKMALFNTLQRQTYRLKAQRY